MDSHETTIRIESADSGTKAYAYLNVRDSLCAWATYRGVLVSPPAKPGFVSVWHAGVLKGGDRNKMLVEQQMEAVRREKFPACTSRLRGMYCFVESDSAIRAQSWGEPFFSTNLAELEVSCPRISRDQHDANWFTLAMANPIEALKDKTWITSYWGGEPCPLDRPIWETIVDGRFTVLGTDLRNRAYGRIKDEFPDSLAWLEVSRISACIGSDLGSICGYLRCSNILELTYWMNMEDAENPNFLDRLHEYRQSENPINHQDLSPHLSQDSFGCVPDLRPYGCSWKLPE